MGTRRRIKFLSKRGKSLDDASVKGMGLLAGKGMYASRSPREGFRPLMEESPLTTMLGERPAAEAPTAAPSSRVVILIELACFVMIAFVAGSALLFYGSDSGPQVPALKTLPIPAAPPTLARGNGDSEATGPAALLQQVEPAAAPEDDVGMDTPGASSEAPAASPSPDDLVPTAPQVALAPEPGQDAPASAAAGSGAPAGGRAVAPTSVPAPPPAAFTASPEEIAMLVQRGGELLKTGDIVGARLSYERAARAGSAAAATGVGKTYDPLYLVSAGVRGIQGDPARAAVWYRKAAGAGEAEAEERLRALQFAFPQ